MKNEYCICCGKPLEGRQLKYCSKECAQLFRNKDFGGTRKPVSKEYLKNQEAKAILLRLELIEKLGGKCSKCGYDKNVAALHFHHLKEKIFSIDTSNLQHKSLESIMNEVDKCILLCANCHTEEHHPSFSKENVRTLAESNIQAYQDYKKIRTPKRKINYCIDCGKEIGRNAKRCQNCATRHRVKYKPFTNVSNSEEQ